jgi:hypothetical protein
MRHWFLDALGSVRESSLARGFGRHHRRSDDAKRDIASVVTGTRSVIPYSVNKTSSLSAFHIDAVADRAQLVINFFPATICL